MDDYGGEEYSVGEAASVSAEPVSYEQREVTEEERKLVARLNIRIAADKTHHKDAYTRMRRSMEIARRGAPSEWPKNNYTANLTGRHIQQSVAALYAKNPKAIARRRERLDFAVWDEDERTLMVAMETATMFQQSMDMMGVPPLLAPQMMPPEAQQAVAIVQDFQQGMKARETIDRIGKTLEILFNYSLVEQKPVDFKTGMKQLVRRAKTACAGFIELGFQRESNTGDTEQRLADTRRQIDHISVLMQKVEKGDRYAQLDADKAELEASVKSLVEQEYVLLREGLIFDFLESTAVIPDKRCRSLVGFIGARWITIERLYTPDEVLGLFKVDLGREFTPYSQEGKAGDADQADFELGDEQCEDLVCVRKHYDRQSGTVYHLADGHKKFLKQPGPPDVYVEDFWPVYALTFNEVEDPKDCFPPSDVELIFDAQMDYNRQRQGLREHRKAARPRFGIPKGALTDEEKTEFEKAEPFSVTEFNPLGDNPDINKLLQAIAMPGVDPNLYDISQAFNDIQVVVGRSEPGFGMSSKATATEAAITEGSSISANDSSVDDLDAFLTTVSRASGQILLREMSREQVLKIVGPGAVWPELSLEDIAGEIYLEVEAGSSGRPNAAQEIANWERMLPFLIQMPKIDPMFLAGKSVKRLDDRLDLTDALGEQFQSIVSMNHMAQPGPADPNAAPDQQGPEGGQNQAPAAPGGPSGTPAAFGNNQI